MTGQPDWQRLAEEALAELPRILPDPAVRATIEQALLTALHRGDPAELRRVLTSLRALRAWARDRVSTEDALRGIGPHDRPRRGLSSEGARLGLLGDGPAPDAGALGTGAGAAPARWINAELEDMAPTDPLHVGQTSTLAFDIDVQGRRNALGAVQFADFSLFPEGVDEVTLTVQLDTDDFDVVEPARPLRLPRTGRSRGKARFDITPRHEGRCFLTATVHHEGNFVQKLDLAVSVGGLRALPVRITSSGRPPSSAVVLHPRDLLLVIEPAPGSGYKCIVINKSVGFDHVTVPITVNALADAVETARQSLMSVINSMDAAGDMVFQAGLDIPQAQRDSALRTLARAGATLFQTLFFPFDGNAELNALGEFIRDIATRPDTKLKLQIAAKEFPVPWGMIYVGDASVNAALSWDNFLGFRHAIEQLPLQTDFTDQSQQIASDKPSLTVSTTMNGVIDTAMQIGVVAAQQRFWAEARATRALLRLVQRDQGDELVQALASPDNDAQVLYFYCHATAPTLGSRGGLGAASLGLADATISLADLKLDAPLNVKLRGRPLVFINACESAELSPLFYEGFVPYFIAKGARGVIGTECKTPALFAAAWGQCFFERFLAGETLGKVVLDLRRAFLRDHGNPLGILYGIHGDGDVYIEPALLPAAAAPINATPPTPDH
jgi:hypothetical protein